MAAFFRELLVFELNPRRPGALVAAHRLAYVEQAAVAGVAIADDWFRDVVAQTLDDGHHVGVGGDAGIGQAVGRGDGAKAGHVEGVKTETVGDARRDHVVDARRGDEASRGAKLIGEGGAAGRKAGHGVMGSVGEIGGFEGDGAVGEQRRCQQQRWQ